MNQHHVSTQKSLTEVKFLKNSAVFWRKTDASSTDIFKYVNKNIIFFYGFQNVPQIVFHVRHSFNHFLMCSFHLPQQYQRAETEHRTTKKIFTLNY